MNNITLNGKVYAVSGWIGKILQFLDRSGGVPTGFASVTVSQDLPAAGSTGTSQRVKWKLKRPTVAEDASSCSCPGSVLRNHILDIVFTAPTTGTSAERQEMLDELDDLVADPYFRASITGLALPS